MSMEFWMWSRILRSMAAGRCSCSTRAVTRKAGRSPSPMAIPRTECSGCPGRTLQVPSRTTPSLTKADFQLAIEEVFGTFYANSNRTTGNLHDSAAIYSGTYTLSFRQAHSCLSPQQLIVQVPYCEGRALAEHRHRPGPSRSL